MPNQFPKTLAALREVAQEETAEHHVASDSAYWAVGDALLEECGTDPTWDVDDTAYTFKGGLALREAADWLAARGIKGTMFSLLWELFEYRELSRIFPPEARRMNITYVAHFEATGMGEEEARKNIAQISAELKPGAFLCTIPDGDGAAFIEYGPA